MREFEIVNPGSDRRLVRARQELRENPKMTVKQLAAHVGLSDSRLEHLIADDGGPSIRELKRRLKIERLHQARRQLLETTNTLTAIREQAGYTYHANFDHDFRKLFGTTPAAYRRSSE